MDECALLSKCPSYLYILLYMWAVEDALDELFLFPLRMGTISSRLGKCLFLAFSRAVQRIMKRSRSYKYILTAKWLIFVDFLVECRPLQTVYFSSLLFNNLTNTPSKCDLIKPRIWPIYPWCNNYWITARESSIFPKFAGLMFMTIFGIVSLCDFLKRNKIWIGSRKKDSYWVQMQKEPGESWIFL